MLRSTLHRDAVRLAAACGFRGIGTIEFLVTGDGQHFFIEANPRLQVEHTVTEEAFGIDLVAIQFSLATGGTLPRIPEARGTSIQARVYLETLELDGSRRPSAGVVQHYRPPLGKGVRVDDGIVPGMGISPRYDPLAAKIIGTGATFHEARLRLLRALDTFELDGVAHNVGLLKRILAEPAFQHQHVDTEWLESNLPRLLESQSTPEASHQNSVTAPTAGTVVYLQADGPVRAGTVLARIEAMKMEFEVKASVSGVLRQRVLVGALVAEGERLADLEPVEEEATSAPEETAVDLDAIRSDLAESVSRHERTLDAARASAVTLAHR
ncbi:MAG: biotin/lipoyl-containing protein, partial [Myxococcota bacterium]